MNVITCYHIGKHFATPRAIGYTDGWVPSPNPDIKEIQDQDSSGIAMVDRRTIQPYGLLHGGVSVVLAETLGSCGAAFSCPEGFRAVGLDINANHIRGVTAGWVTGTARPVHIGRTTQVWHIDLHNEAGGLTCVSRITMAVQAER
ncbi:MAG: hotdog fold thioesterase [Rhodoferax sp.]|nr:hotdog fold thioesterase [Rhodoferax sp.]